MFNVLGGKPAATKESIQGKTNGALAMFHIAIEKLEESNQESIELATNNQKIIDELENTNAELDKLTASNQTVIDNIKTMLGI